MSAENKLLGDGNRSESHGQGRVQGTWTNNQNRGQQSFGNDRPPRRFDNRANQSYDNSNRGYQERNNSYSTSSNRNFHSQSNQYGGNRKDYSHIRYPGDVELSKEIVRIVRHGKYKWIKMDKEGYVKVNDILNDSRFKSICGEIDFNQVQRIVDHNDKKRFEMKQMEKEWYIKAVQGHTVQVESLALTAIEDPNQFENVFHGTYFVNWEMIKETGLNRLARNHIHFAIGLADDPKVISGMRKSCEVAIEIEMEKAMKAGIKFFISSNNVILSEGDSKGRIHPKFFRRVIEIYPFRNIPFDVPSDYNDNEENKPATKRSAIPGMAAYQPPAARDKKPAVSKQEEKPVPSKPKEDVVPPDQFENLSIQENQLSVPDEPPPHLDVQEVEKNLPDVVGRTAEVTEESSVKDVKPENDTLEKSEVPAKKRRGGKRGGKKKKNEDPSNQVPDAPPVEKLKFELPKKHNNDVKFERPVLFQQKKNENTTEKSKENNKGKNKEEQQAPKENTKGAGKKGRKGKGKK